MGEAEAKALSAAIVEDPTFLELGTRLEQVEVQLSAVKAELVAFSARRDRFGVGGNRPPEAIDIEEAATTIQVGIFAARVLRKEIPAPAPQIDVLELAWLALQQAWRVIVRVGEWFGSKADKFVDAYAAAAGESLGKWTGRAVFLVVLEQLALNLPELIRELEPLVRSLGGH